MTRSDAHRNGSPRCYIEVECEAVCPKKIKLENIARMNHDFLLASWTYREETAAAGAG